jgi:hypothetical protein
VIHLILAISLGAIACHFIRGTWRDAVPALITAPLSAFVAGPSRKPLLEVLSMTGLLCVGSKISGT